MLLPGAFLTKENEKTFQYDNSLPSLPVPTLEHTLYRYLDSVRPLVTEEEFTKTEAIAKEFAAGVGKELQRKLLEKSNHVRNWLEEWWEQFAYLITRTPHAPFMVMAGPGPYNMDVWPPKDGTQIERIALLTWTGMKYWKNLREQRLAVDRGSKTINWTMHQYQRMFNCCKIPGMNIDSLKPYFKTEEEGPCPSHIVVLVNGRMFSFNSIGANGEPYTPPVLEKVLSDIKQTAYSGSAGPALGRLTTLPRENWFQLREHLIGLHANNEKLLEILQSAVFCLSLDERNPPNFTEAVRLSFLDDCTDRWFDKSYSTIVYQNGMVACACDHSPAEAMTLISSSVWNLLAVELNGYQWQGPPDANIRPEVRELKFVVDSKILDGVREAKEVFKQNGSNVDLLYEEFKDYGKEFIRSHKLHPDTYVQMALQLAYYRLYHKGVPTYETAVTRQFYHGRTETLRSCTTETIDMCRAMLDGWASVREKKEKLVFAMEKHNRLMQEGTYNSGCDRHLMGLQIVAFEEGIDKPELFSDPSWLKSGGNGNFLLSTSFLGFTPATGLVPPMCAGGYGFFYSIIDSQIQFYATCYKSDKANGCRLFVDAFTQSLRDIRQLLDDTSSAPKL